MNDIKPMLEMLKTVGSYAGVLYAFGFLVVRVRLNALGVWSGLPVVDANYLSEGALFMVATLLTLAVPSLIVLAPAAALGWIVHVRWRDRWNRIAERLRKRLPFVQIALITALLVAVPVRTSAALKVAGQLLSGKKPLPSYAEIVCWSAATIVTWYWVRQQALLPRLFQWLIGMLSVVVVVFLLPINYAVSMRCSEFPRATIVLDDAESASGWLLYDATDFLVFYDKDARTIRTLAHKSVRETKIADYVKFK